MRMWALTDEQVAASVRRSDGRVLRAVRQAFADYGFGADEAALRSAVMFNAHASWWRLDRHPLHGPTNRPVSLQTCS